MYSLLQNTFAAKMSLYRKCFVPRSNLSKYGTLFFIALVSLIKTISAEVDVKLLRELAPKIIQEAMDESTHQGLQERQILSNLCARMSTPPDITVIRHHAFLPPSEQSLQNSNLARIVERATSVLAARTGATVDDVQKFAQQIETRQTALGQQCPGNFQNDNQNCTEQNLNIRAIDGRCTNLRHPLWGVSGTAFSRLLGANYEDGIAAPRKTSKVNVGQELPMARHVSTCMSPMFIKAHRTLTNVFVFFGQILDHDLGLAPMARIDNPTKTSKIPPLCCGTPRECKHTECFEMQLPVNDPQYSKIGRRCMEFVRSVPALRESCRLGYREQVNEPTHWLDASHTYASTPERQRTSRAFVDGLLATSNAPLAVQNEIELTPSRDDDFECVSQPGKPCFFGGDPRINENVMLTAMHQVFLREHNRIARAFKTIGERTGRSTTDEDLYQAARKVVIAEVQHIVYNEFLPVLLGESIMSDAKNELELCSNNATAGGGISARRVNAYCSNGYYTGYDQNVPPHVSHEFSTAAFRMGHTLLPEFFFRSFLDQDLNVEERLADNFFNVSPLFERGAVAGILYGSMIKNAEAYDSTIVRSVREDLFQERKSNRRVGMDLFALNLQRSRDHGLQFYNDYRELCGLGRAATFADLADAIDASTIEKLKCAYASVDDIELFTGGLSELPVNNNDGIVGPTFACIIAQQFHQLKKGDRFWYENPLQFTQPQLAEVRKCKLSKMFCDTASEIKLTQPFVMLQPTPSINAERPCSELESIDLEVLATLLPAKNK